jgi:acylphosphatase
LRAAAVREERTAKRYFVSGMVQGVGYRYFAQGVAERLGLHGFTRNLSDGRVEVYAIGARKSLEALRLELEHGPRAARVSGVSEQEAEIDPTYAHAFSVEYDA